MIFRKLEAKLDNKYHTYWAKGWLGKDRVRKPLGTVRAGTADTRVDWIKRACEEGAASAYWPQLKHALPPNSFAYFAGLVGYVEQPKPVETALPTWTDLKNAYIASLTVELRRVSWPCPPR